MASYTLSLAAGAIRRRLSTWIKLRSWQPSLLLRLVFLVVFTFFGGLTARVLLWDVHSVDDLTVDHYMIIGSMIGAIVSGLFCWPMLKQGKILIGLGLGVACIVTTGFCFISSGGRADDLAFQRNATARQINQDRDRAQRNRDEARRRYDTALEAETAECSGGAGPKCKAKRETTQERRSDFEVSELLLQQSKPEQRENAKLKRAAQIIGLITRSTEDDAERALAIVWPFLPPFSCELLTIIFGHLAFCIRWGFSQRREEPEKPTVSEPTVSPQKPKPCQRRSFSMRNRCWNADAMRKLDAERDLAGYIASNGTVPSQEFLRDRWKVRSKGTVSRWLRDWETRGLIQRRSDGRFKVTSAKVH